MTTIRVILVALGVATLALPAHATDTYHWVQYVPDGLEVRATTDRASCPALTFDGAAATFTERSTPGEGYPIRVCSSAIPAGTKSATIDGVPLALPVARPTRILVIGDTGCRMKGNVMQACNDAALWPFRVGSDVAALFKPDLVLHVGDFHYRETQCPAEFAGCAGSPSGDNWAVWKADFFAPAELLLGAAPWIFVRGNHEECERGGKGWARTLDPYPWDVKSGLMGCLGVAKPFVADLGDLKIVVVDTSTADEDVANPDQAKMFRTQFQSIGELAPTGPVWVAFHRPIWAISGLNPKKAGGDNKTLALAARDAIPANVQALLSGHQHTFQVVSYEDDLPVQIVSGHGGDELSFWSPTNPAGLTINGVKVKAGMGRPGKFGFSLLERDRDDPNALWAITDYTVTGEALGRCVLNGRKVECK